MPVIGTPRTYHKKFQFVVEVDGLGSAAFMEATELSAEVAEVTQWEGGSPIAADKSPGRVTMTDLTLSRGATQDEDLYSWFLDVVDAASGLGLADPLYKRMVDIVQLDRDGTELRRWRLHNAWPKKFVASDGWNNDSDENVIESVTLAFDFFERV